MHIEVDQSGKIESYLDTVVAFINKEQFSILLDKKIKNELLIKYREKHKDIHYRLFAILVYLCIKNYLDRVTLITIDDEYEGRSRDVKKHLLRFIQRSYPNFDKKIIKFSKIGKKSRAHRIAYQTFAKRLAPNKIVGIKEVEKFL